MIKQIFNYTFNKTNKTITFNDYTSINQAGIISVTNITAGGVVLYHQSQVAPSSGTVATNVLTLNYNTSSMSNSDLLVILYDDGTNNTYDSSANLKTADQNLSTAISGGKVLVTETNSASIKNDLDALAVSIASILTNTNKIPSQGQALAAFCTPVVLPSTQVPPFETRYTGGATATFNNNICLVTPGNGNFSCAGFGSISLQISASAGITAGVITFEGSADNANFIPIPMLNLATGLKVTTLAPTASTNYFLVAPIVFVYFRARISTAISGGTVTCYTRQMPWAMSPSVNYIAG